MSKFHHLKIICLFFYITESINHNNHWKLIKCPMQAKDFGKMTHRIYEKQRKVARYFLNPGECIFFMRIQPLLDKLGGLTWKWVSLISEFSKPPPTTFETPKVQPPHIKGGSEFWINGDVLKRSLTKPILPHFWPLFAKFAPLFFSF